MTSKDSQTCKTDGCGRLVLQYRRRGLCQRCYLDWWKHRPDRPGCSVADCELKADPSSKGMCNGHYHRLKRYGDPLAGPGRGSPGKRRGMRRMEGRYVTREGYVRIRRPDGVGRDLWVLEHRYVMEQVLGRRLYPDEQVHHKNEPKTDNSPGNLELWVKRQPTGHRVEDVLAWAHQMIARYEQAA